MGGCFSTPTIPDPQAAAAEGIAADTELQPFNAWIQALSTLGRSGTYEGQTYDFTGLGQADVSRQISDKMAQTLLDLQKEKSPEMIRQRLAELQAADPQGYAARQQLFDQIMAQATENPTNPISTDLQNKLQSELSKGVGFDDAKQEAQVRDAARGGQVASGIYLGNAPAKNEAGAVVSAGENLRNQRQANALAMLSSGTSPEDVAYRHMQQVIGNLGDFAGGRTPESQFGSVSNAGNFFTPSGAPNTNTFNPNAAGQGLNNALGVYGGQVNWANSTANPWLAGLSNAASAWGAYNRINQPVG